MEHPAFCPHCGAATVGTMKFCTSCGKSVLPEAPAVQPSPPSKTSPTLLIILVIVGCLLLAFLGSLGGKSRASSGADPISAYVMCKQFVTDRLKSPSTAVFPTYSTSGTQTDQLSTLQFRVRAYVDSQNSFGANIRTQYTCTVTNTGGNNWNLDSLTTD